MANETLVAATNSRIQQLNSSISSAQSQLGTANSALTTSKNSLASEQTKFNALSQQLASSYGTSAYSGLSASVNASAIQLTTLKSQVSTNQSTVNTLTTQLSTLQKSLTQANRDLAAAQSASDTGPGNTASSTPTTLSNTTSTTSTETTVSTVIDRSTGTTYTIDSANPNVRVIKYTNGITETVQSFPNTAVEEVTANVTTNAQFLEANTTELQGEPLTQPRTAEEEAFLAANTDPAPSNPSNIVDTGVTRDQAAFLEANISGDTPAPISSDQQAFLDANTAELQGDDTPQGQATFLEANNTELQSENNVDRERERFLEANADPQGDSETAENNAETQRLQNRGSSALKSNTEAKATSQDINNAKANGDWRVRISLASKADYFYRSKEAGILKPLDATDGVIFPYTPTISVGYTAQYDQQSVTHSNYKTTQYTSSSVDAISISCDFTAQDTYEATYLLAVIHFFRSLTKMFYGQDENPSRGTPPPLCYLHGYGDFQFNKHPMAITGFTYALPNDVDYIRTDTTSFSAGEPMYTKRSSSTNPRGAPTDKTKDSTPPIFKNSQVQPTYVPTKISLSISAIPVVARYDVSNKFSLKDYASGRLLLGNKEKCGGFW